MRSSVTSILAVFVVALAALAGACSSDGSNAAPSWGETKSPTVPKAACADRCKAKLSSCGAPESAANDGCVQVCGSGITESDLSCIEQKGCDDLARSESLNDLCHNSISDAGTSVVKDSQGPTPVNPLPTELTVTAHFGSAKAIHVLGSDQKTLASSVSIAGSPSFSPSAPNQLPNVFNASFTVSSPTRDGCTQRVSLTLSRSQLSASMTSSETLPATGCATFADQIAEHGVSGTVEQAPYPNGGSAKLHVSLVP